MQSLRPCPPKLDVASITRFLNLASAQGQVPETVRERYGALFFRREEMSLAASFKPDAAPVLHNRAFFQGLAAGG